MGRNRARRDGFTCQPAADRFHGRPAQSMALRGDRTERKWAAEANRRVVHANELDLLRNANAPQLQFLQCAKGLQVRLGKNSIESDIAGQEFACGDAPLLDAPTSRVDDKIGIERQPGGLQRVLVSLVAAFTE